LFFWQEQWLREPAHCDVKRELPIYFFCFRSQPNLSRHLTHFMDRAGVDY